jgi:hypothetical protein
MARHHTPEERRAHVDAWRQSDRTQTAYASHLAVSPQTLSRWATDEPWPLPAFVEMPTARAVVALAMPSPLSATVKRCQVSFLCRRRLLGLQRH